MLLQFFMCSLMARLTALVSIVIYYLVFKNKYEKKYVMFVGIFYEACLACTKGSLSCVGWCLFFCVA